MLCFHECQHKPLPGSNGYVPFLNSLEKEVCAFLADLEDVILSDTAIQEQQSAPDFTLPAVGSDDIVKNGQVHLADLKGHAVVLYFYPKED